MPMYHVEDLQTELAYICTLIEALHQAERAKWDALEDRHLLFSAGLPEIATADLLKPGFTLPGSLLNRLHAARFRVSMTLQMDGNPVRFIG